MSRSQKWKDEWAFFLGDTGRRRYADLCRRCIHDCKQSFRAEVIVCPGYISKRSGSLDKAKDYCCDKCKFQPLSTTCTEKQLHFHGDSAPLSRA